MSLRREGSLEPSTQSLARGGSGLRGPHPAAGFHLCLDHSPRALGLQERETGRRRVHERDPDKTEGSAQTKLATRKGELAPRPDCTRRRREDGPGACGGPAGRRAPAGSGGSRRVGEEEVKGTAWGGLTAAGHSPEPPGRLRWRRTDRRRRRPAEVWTRGQGCSQPAAEGRGRGGAPW